MKFGYARISTTDQNLDLQIDALKKEGCEKIFQETVTGASGVGDCLRRRRGALVTVMRKSH